METSEAKKTVKPVSKKSTTSAIRVSPETCKRLLAELGKINKKPHGKRVKVDALIVRLLAKISAQDVSELQESSLSGRDRLEQNHRAYCTKFGTITMDQFLDLISRETVPQILKGDAAKSPSE
ncbi:MAG: hypothetical protein K2X47_03960, partial [Bdellovibrionales bacterium]|nr:hypothetical protein [Bdellovibrionales bacterium]